MSATRVECLYCGQVLVCSEGLSQLDVIAAAAKHDQDCGCNPLVVELRRLRAENAVMAQLLKPYATLAQLSAGKPGKERRV